MATFGILACVGVLFVAAVRGRGGATPKVTAAGAAIAGGAGAVAAAASAAL